MWGTTQILPNYDYHLISHVFQGLFYSRKSFACLITMTNGYYFIVQIHYMYYIFIQIICFFNGKMQCMSQCLNSFIFLHWFHEFSICTPLIILSQNFRMFKVMIIL
jgi:hypothetical protein